MDIIQVVVTILVVCGLTGLFLWLFNLIPVIAQSMKDIVNKWVPILVLVALVLWLLFDVWNLGDLMNRRSGVTVGENPVAEIVGDV